jgi:hypothetical protein
MTAFKIKVIKAGKMDLTPISITSSVFVHSMERAPTMTHSGEQIFYGALSKSDVLPQHNLLSHLVTWKP